MPSVDLMLSHKLFSYTGLRLRKANQCSSGKKVNSHLTNVTKNSMKQTEKCCND